MTTVVVVDVGSLDRSCQEDRDGDKSSTEFHDEDGKAGSLVTGGV